MVVMTISDILTMNFFWLVKDEGSWLDIGTSITNFTIASLLCVFVAGLEFVSEIIVSGMEVGGNVGGKKGIVVNDVGTVNGKELHANGYGVHKSNGVLR